MQPCYSLNASASSTSANGTVFSSYAARRGIHRRYEGAPSGVFCRRRVHRTHYAIAQRRRAFLSAPRFLYLPMSRHPGHFEQFPMRNAARLSPQIVRICLESKRKNAWPSGSAPRFTLWTKAWCAVITIEGPYGESSARLPLLKIAEIVLA
ncbi:MAG: hypothetical protein JWL59_3502 [Chthoniobacteraceae bacterium]|nr:hypothetical protein [Chthoniobacteraceae bacterium]